jgi:hypothetical protein
MNRDIDKIPEHPEEHDSNHHYCQCDRHKTKEPKVITFLLLFILLVIIIQIVGAIIEKM